MSQLRKLVSLVAALLLLAVALPSIAASVTKYAAVQFPAVVPTGDSVQITIKVTNATPPPGVSTLNSFAIYLPPNFVTNPPTITFLSVVSPKASLSGPFTDASGTYYQIADFKGINSGGFANFVFLVKNTATVCAQGTWGFTAYAGNSLSGDKFLQSPTNPSSLTSAIGCEGVLACDTLGTPFAFEDTNAVGIRGKFNKEGSPCVQVGYTFTDYVGTGSNIVGLGSNFVHLVWDTVSQPYAAFSYTVTWDPVLLDSDGSGWTSRRPVVSWVNDGGGSPIFVPALVCVGENLPLPYGTLSSAVNSSATSISVNLTGTVPLPPFVVTIDSEQMQVTLVSGAANPYSFTVLRGQNGTAAAAHSSGASVMSLPQALPEPYGTLKTAIGAGDGTITITGGSNLPVGAGKSFPIVMPASATLPVGTLPERLQATWMSGTTSESTYSVTRGQGGTPANAHDAGQYVMSTPLPLNPGGLPFSGYTAPHPYATGMQAHMCVSESGWRTFGLDASGNTLVQYTDTFIDIGDGWGGHP